MTVVKKLIYGSDEIPLRDDADIESLLQRINQAVDSDQSHWVEVEGQSHPKWILVTTGIQISVESFERKPIRIGRTL